MAKFSAVRVTVIRVTVITLNSYSGEIYRDDSYSYSKNKGYSKQLQR